MKLPFEVLLKNISYLTKALCSIGLALRVWPSVKDIQQRFHNQLQKSPNIKTIVRDIKCILKETLELMSKTI